MKCGTFLRLFVILLVSLLWIIAPIYAANQQIIGPQVWDTLHSKGSVRVMVAFTKPNINFAEAKKINSRIAEQRAAILAQLPKKDIVVKRVYKSVSAIALVLKSEKALVELAMSPGVERIDVDEKLHPMLNQSRPRIRADDAHAMGITGEGRVVAVIDSGIDTDHADLSDDIDYQICFCSDGCCPNGTSRQEGSGAAEDQNGHGTHVSGIITSKGVQAPVGIAPDARILAIKTGGPDGTSYSSDNVAALDWVYNNRRDVDAVNMSLGSTNRYSGDCDDSSSWNRSYSQAINNLRSIGIMVCVATGNDSDSTGISSPACIANAIAVGASWDTQERIAVFSNSSPSLDVWAPGRRITAPKMGGGQVTYDGTSMATPHVTAVVALLRQNDPSLTAAELENALETSPVMLTDSRNGVTAARVDVIGAMNAQKPTTSPVYRFFSEKNQRHFYTISEEEYLYILANYSSYIWKYEGIVMYAYPTYQTGLTPVYRFWSDVLQSHFYTAGETEKDYILANYPDEVWRLESTAWYAKTYADTGVSPVYRFWSPSLGSHFYTISDEEKDYLNINMGDIWHYEGIGWYSIKP